MRTETFAAILLATMLLVGCMGNGPSQNNAQPGQSGQVGTNSTLSEEQSTATPQNPGGEAPPPPPQE